MNRLLIVVGLGCFATALLVWGVRSNRQTQTGIAPSTDRPAPVAVAVPEATSTTPTSSISATPPGTAQHSPTPLLAVDHPSVAHKPPKTLRPAAGHIAYAAAHGRPDGFRVVVSSDGPAVLMQAMPTTGTAELLYRSNLGGVEIQQWASATWTLLDESVQVDHLSTTAGESAGMLELALIQGKWRVVVGDATPETRSAATEIARTVRMLHAGLGAGASRAPGQGMMLGGEAFRIIVAKPSALIIAAVKDAEDRPAFAVDYPGPAGWNDVVIWLDGQGHWTTAERLVGAPATPEEPGFLVRRIVLHGTNY